MTLGLVSQRFLCSDKLFHSYFPLYFSSKFFLYIFLHNFLIFSRKSSARQRLSLTVGTSRSPRIRNRFARPTEKRRTTISCTPSENPTKFRSTLSTIIFPSELWVRVVILKEKFWGSRFIFEQKTFRLCLRFKQTRATLKLEALSDISIFQIII